MGNNAKLACREKIELHCQHWLRFDYITVELVFSIMVLVELRSDLLFRQMTSKP